MVLRGAFSQVAIGLAIGIPAAIGAGKLMTQQLFILASLTSTCRRHDVDPQLYLTQLLINLLAVQMSELAAWLPDQWKIRQAARTPAR
jgi:hypothetical protein